MSDGYVSDELWKALCDDISDRRGLKHEWNAIDDDTKQEICKAWSKILATPHLQAQPQRVDAVIKERDEQWEKALKYVHQAVNIRNMPFSDVMNMMRARLSVRKTPEQPQSLHFKCPACECKWQFHTQEQLDMIQRHFDAHREHAPKLTGKVREVWERRLGTIGAKWTEQFAAETVAEIINETERTK